MYSIKNLNFTPSQFNKIIEFANKRPYILVSSEYLQINRVLSYITFSSKEFLVYLLKFDKICNSVIADLRNKEVLENAIIDFQPDFVFHLAAQPLVRLSYDIPAETFEVNVNGIIHIAYWINLFRFCFYP